MNDSDICGVCGRELKRHRILVEKLRRKGRGENNIEMDITK
jgi:hypothetical protein